MKLDESQIDRWREFLDKQAGNTKWMDRHHELDQRRVRVQREILDLLGSFLSGSITIDQLRAIFDNKTRNEWVGFGFKGLSGAMFLNKLLKHIPDQDALAEQLRSVLPLPPDEHAGRARMTSFMSFLVELVESGHTTKQLLQPARAPFFVSGCWHLQGVEQWPIYYISARRAFKQEKLLAPAGDPVDDYFTFRECFLALASALGLKSWPFEHLCAWYDEYGTGDKEPSPPTIDETEDEEEENEKIAADEPSHTEVQWLLATIGRSLGCRIWIAQNDHGKEWHGTKLGTLSVSALPNLGMGNESQKVISLIDVLWLTGSNQVAAAFEVEHSTSVYSGLLRMSDLTALSPNLFFPLYIVAPQERLAKVRKQLSRPTFQTLELHKRCGFFSCEKLKAAAENIERWATDPSAIDKLASRVEDASGEDVS